MSPFPLWRAGCDRRISGDFLELILEIIPDIFAQSFCNLKYVPSIRGELKMEMRFRKTKVEEPQGVVQGKS